MSDWWRELLSRPPPLVLCAAAALVGGGAVLWLRRRRRQRTWQPAGLISRLCVYPLKSGVAVECDSLWLDQLGSRSGENVDRCLTVVSEGKAVTCVQRGRTSRISAKIDGGVVTLAADGLPELRVPLPQPGDPVDLVPAFIHTEMDSGVHLGEEAAVWLTKFFNDGKQYSLVYMMSDEVTPRRLMDQARPYAHLATPDVQVRFQYQTAVSLSCDASLDQLQSHTDVPVGDASFRHNLYVSGAPAFADDRWKYVRVGGATLRRVKSIQRCATTTVNSQTGKHLPSSEPLRTLRKVRLGRTREERRMFGEAPLFGSHMAVQEEGEVAVGDAVYVRER